jgi:hypothetical protein
METIAIYREAIIKTYGLAEWTGLCLVTFDLPSDRMDHWGDHLMHFIAQSGGSLLLLMAQPESTGTLRILVLLEDTPETWPGPDQPALSEGDQRVFWQVFPDVELVSFQGPHYGDRYGIASAALRALAVHEIPLLGFICAGASVYLIIRPGQGHAARTALEEAFMEPKNSGGDPKA